MLRPLSSGRFRVLSFDSVFFLAVQKENEWKGGLGRALQKMKTNIFSERFVDYHVEENYRTNYLNNSNKAIQIIDSPYFDVRVMEVSKPFHRDLRKYDSFIISMCIEGDCMIKVRSTGDEIILKEGYSALIPAAIADYDIIPLKNTTRILDAFIDNQNNRMADKITRFLHFSD